MQQETVMAFPHPPLPVEAPLTEGLRQGAQRRLAQAIEAEVAGWLAPEAARQDTQGRQGIVRNGSLPAREVHTGRGAVRVPGPRGRERSGAGIRFHSVLLPPYRRRATSLAALLPGLSLKGISTGDFSEALQALLGPEAPGLSPATLSRLTQGWQEALPPWHGRDLSSKRSVYCWGDGVYCETRLEAARHGVLVLLGADAHGQKARVGFWDGDRESEQSWKALLLDLQSRGLAHGPALAIGDGALGFWQALRQV